MSKRKKILIGFGVVIAVLFIGGYIGVQSLRIPPPEIADRSAGDWPVIQSKTGEIKAGKCMLRQSKSGLWEMYLEGNAFERGTAAGKISKDLLYYQEKVFVDQIKELIPSENYLMFLRNFIAFFNRKLPDNIPQEYKEEIYGISLSCTDEYDFIGTPYERQLNYHAAHDLGHALQDYMLVGCTSFASWGNNTEDSCLLIGRNFDFYAGDKFAENKTVTFCNPDKGYKFASVGWAGMIGVLSGMNEHGLTVTINAAKSTMPTSAETPISILCREILQYASTIDEAYAIASGKKTFVSESILIGSANDNCAAIIEKSPDNIGLYRSPTNELICANHFQSDVFKQDEANKENIRTSDSPYRQQRMEELLASNKPLNPIKAASILRNKQGLGDKNIGWGNEKSINQLIAHHSVIFEPHKRMIRVSTAPWQLGEYVAYDLTEIFRQPDFSKEIITEELTIPKDIFLQSPDYARFKEYRIRSLEIKKAIRNKTKTERIKLNEFAATNPELYYVYDLIGDYYASEGTYDRALFNWKTALEKEIPRLSERENIQKKMNEYLKK